MTLSKQQLSWQFDKEGYLFLPDLFSAEEIAVLRREAGGDFPQLTARKSGARSRARRGPRSQRTPTTRRFGCSARILG